jgi:hypothetical protein
MIAPSDQERPPRWQNYSAEEWVCFAVVPNASTSSLAHALALSALTHVCLLVPLIFDWLPPCCSFLELGPMTQTDLSPQCGYYTLIINMTNKTNKYDRKPYIVQGRLRIPSNGTS